MQRCNALPRVGQPETNVLYLLPDDPTEGNHQAWRHSFELGDRDVTRMLERCHREAMKNRDWLYQNMPRYFFITMRNEIEAITNLILGLERLRTQRKIVLLDQARKFMVARLDVPGSLYDTLVPLQGRDISYAEITHSRLPVSDTGRNLEVLRFEFDRKEHHEITGAPGPRISTRIRETVFASLRDLYPDFAFKEFKQYLNLLWLNNDQYVRWSPPERVARILWLYHQCVQHDGLFLDVEETCQEVNPQESRVLFSVENPPHPGFLTQTMEVFKRLGIGVRRAYCLNISNGRHPYFLGNFYVSSAREGKALTSGSGIFKKLKTELYNTQILSMETGAYVAFVAPGAMSGEDASLTNALAAFCHTTLSHARPDRFSSETVQDALLGNPDLLSKLIDLFRKRFDPELARRDEEYALALEEAQAAINNYNTGYKHLDEIRRTIYQTCFLFITRTLKTNFFVTEKRALAFRLDPTYLSEIGPEFTSDLPRRRPFGVTFFYGRRGAGYHVGFSHIARGGWRTIICRTQDELTSNTANLFREVFVLAHTQHLKNKDIYEGGAKLAVVMDARDLASPEAVRQQLYKLQYAFINAFLDLLVTVNGRAKDCRVVDYYGDDEPVELGPDENMHDSMIELIAQQATRRGYLLGGAIMSGKEVGINHKQYGVTSRGVVKAATIALRQTGLDALHDAFTVKFTGGPNGDVAGNAMRLLLRRCPRVRITSIIDASGVLYDPEGADQAELLRLVHQDDIGGFNPQLLHPGGHLLLGRESRQESMKRLYRKLTRTGLTVEETWITADEYQRELETLLFSVPVDLFLPCGGRPETIDAQNCHRFFLDEQQPSARVIVEGANSFLSPEARIFLQKGGVTILRDATANKCGVITSSYEIIANLLMTGTEFLKHKETYVKDVFRILDRKVEDEVKLIFERHQNAEGKLLYTEVSAAISEEINALYDRTFDTFQKNPERADEALYTRIMLHHMPALIRDNPKYRDRVKNLPAKIKWAILASEIASSIVYGGGWSDDFEDKLSRYVASHFD